jgi:hypothetical protein
MTHVEIWVRFHYEPNQTLDIGDAGRGWWAEHVWDPADPYRTKLSETTRVGGTYRIRIPVPAEVLERIEDHTIDVAPEGPVDGNGVAST